MLRNHFQPDWLIIVLLTVMALSCAWLYRDFVQDIRLISHLMSVLCLWMSGIVLHYLGKKEGALLAAAVALIFMSNPLLISAIGMETFFLIAILLLTLQNYLVDRLNRSKFVVGRHPYAHPHHRISVTLFRLSRSQF
jgi:hypothetical protein